MVNETELKHELNKCKKRFKGVENFIRRVAFNLGNTPSQTEVKIISCIPIDVTDLQQKIVQLERQLEDARNKNTKDDSVATARSVKSAKENDKEKNAKEDTNVPNELTPDGKDKSGKESKDVKDKTRKNFRNETVKVKSRTNSKGEVKEKGSKDEEVKNLIKKNSKGEVKDKSKKDLKKCSCNSNSLANKTSIHTAICGQRFSRLRDNTGSNESDLLEDSCTSRFTCSSTMQNNSTASSRFPTSAIPNNYRYLLKGDCKNTDNWSPKTIKKLFCNKRKLRKNKTHFVYYAQTDLSPFNSYEMTSDSTTYYHEMFDCNYLTDIIKKQYQPVPVVDDLSDRSKFTSPICRDEHLNSESCPYESDICSCFQGMFYDVDKYLSENSTIHAPLINNRDIYNDSSLYDVIPVKEKSIEYCYNSSKDKDAEVEMKCWPEHVRVKPRTQPIIVNYHTISRCSKNCVNLKARWVNDQKRQKGRLNKTPLKEEQTSVTSSNSCNVDLSNVYTKKIVPKTKDTQTSEIIQSGFIDYRRTPTNNVQPENLTKYIKQENKAEATLGQIKNILKTVLTEVKENALKHEEKAKKDVNLQKGLSQSNLQEGSSLLNSFTYSPFNINPHQATCSRQMASNLCCYQGVPPMQNYPLIIQTPRRHLCNSCFRNSHYRPPRKNNPLIPNTDKYKEQRYKETDKLIREIYKSVALDIPTKDTSGSEYNLDSFNTEKETDIKVLNTETRKTEDPISEIFLNRNINTDTSESNAVSATVQGDSVERNSKLSTINSNNTQTDFPKADKNIQLSMDTDSETAVESRDEKNKHDAKKESSTENEKEASTSGTDSEQTVVPNKKEKENKKIGLFSRMMNIFNKRKTENNVKVESEAESSDSEDYQTVNNQPVEKPNRKQKHVIKFTKKPHSARPKGIKKANENKNRRKPYMEQEYRRHWNERLMFEREKMRHSSEQPFWWETKRPEPLYRQNIEARNVFVKPQPRIDHTKYTFPIVAPQTHPIYYSPKYDPCPKINVNAELNTYPTKQTPRSKNKISFASKADYENKPKGLLWLKNYNLGVRCGEQWKKFILES